MIVYKNLPLTREALQFVVARAIEGCEVGEGYVERGCRLQIKCTQES